MILDHEWQPIEQANKKETILATDGSFIFVCRWRTTQQYPYHKCDGWCLEIGGYTLMWPTYFVSSPAISTKAMEIYHKRLNSAVGDPDRPLIDYGRED